MPCHEALLHTRVEMLSVRSVMECGGCFFGVLLDGRVIRVCAIKLMYVHCSVELSPFGLAARQR